MLDHTLEVPKFEGDVTNTQLVSDAGEAGFVIASPLPVMTKQQALILAAWIVAIGDTSENFEEFRRILKAVLEA